MRSWSRSPRARSSTTGTGSVDGHLHRAHPGWGDDPGRGPSDRAAPLDRDPPGGGAVGGAGRRVPANRLSAVERLEILAVLDAPRFVDLPPMQIWTMLLDEGTYLCSISTLYRILADHAQLVERRRIARHPARTVPELVATGPGQVYTWDITKLAGPAKGILRRLRDDRRLLPLHRRCPGPPAGVRAA